MGGSLGAKASSLAPLLAASLLSLCFMLTGGFKTTTITADPSKPLEGQSLSLTVSDIPNNTVSCRWFRGEIIHGKLILITYRPPIIGTTEGNSFTGREVLKPDCSLHIRDLTVNDSGSYSVLMDGPGIYAEGKMDIVVAALETDNDSHHDTNNGTDVDTRGLSTSSIAGIVVGCTL
ncbi:carcinoembryonic antigen-related cell adhesion molecule 6-like [Sceloporus undulatus]|uniref:carcinoembryonic antigen-related cell adhesion molecule 6-like n=1 Tax=Sceloporus undulatus TaxID=8520 RepID=UPI001C4AD099|nr:carcinoembryonic antigen-related cell adhesion molecule 6-like [Sceloporus undulatus]